MTHVNPSDTPNVVIESPNLRKGINIALWSAGVILGTVIVVDGASPAFELSAYTNPISAGLLYLGSAFGFAVTLPNIPKR
jgi:hypothetical protein